MTLLKNIGYVWINAITCFIVSDTFSIETFFCWALIRLFSVAQLQLYCTCREVWIYTFYIDQVFGVSVFIPEWVKLKLQDFTDRKWACEVQGRRQRPYIRARIVQRSFCSRTFAISFSIKITAFIYFIIKLQISYWIPYVNRINVIVQLILF